MNKCSISNCPGPTDGQIFGALPIRPKLMVVSGQWQVTEGKPAWVWSFADGSTEVVDAVDVMWRSTKQSDLELFHQEVSMKVKQVYEHFNLPLQEEYLAHALSIRSARWAPRLNH